MSTAVENEVATFYAWIENMPSSRTVRISGGQRVKDANGNILPLGMKEIRFNNGIYHTDDPEVIEVLRRKIARGDSMTEEAEKYYAAVLPPEKNNERLSKKLDEQRAYTNRLLAEIKREREGGTVAGPVDTGSARRKSRAASA